MKRRPPARRRQHGATLIEVLVSLVILMVGLLGLVGVMIQSQRAQLESYQRVQALLLVQDMASRLGTNVGAADCYVPAAAVGTGAAALTTTPGCTLAATDPKQVRALADLNEWSGLLKGSAELSGTTAVGAILGARGCIAKSAVTGVFQVSVAWQGVQAAGAPPAGITCGTGSYGGDESQRRAVAVTVLPGAGS